jgi:hypothetical protein
MVSSDGDVALTHLTFTVRLQSAYLTTADASNRNANQPHVRYRV